MWEEFFILYICLPIAIVEFVGVIAVAMAGILLDLR
jgi:hypothetical protein